MTAEEKTSVACFIDLASDMTRGGYFRGEREYHWEDSAPKESAPGTPAAQNPLVMVIGEFSDSGEDAALLDKMLDSIGLSKESNCFITNGIECEGRIQSLKPRFILCLGEAASQTLLHSAEPLEKLRGRLIDYKTEGVTIPLAATYHPGDLLRNEEYKRPCWADLKMLRAAFGPSASEGK